MELAKAFAGISFDMVQKIGPVVAVPCTIAAIIAILTINSRKPEAKINAAESILISLVVGAAFLAINVWLPPLRAAVGI